MRGTKWKPNEKAINLVTLFSDFETSCLNGGKQVLVAGIITKQFAGWPGCKDMATDWGRMAGFYVER